MIIELHIARVELKVSLTFPPEPNLDLKTFLLKWNLQHVKKQSCQNKVDCRKSCEPVAPAPHVPTSCQYQLTDKHMEDSV